MVTSQNKNQVETKDTGCFGCLQDALTGYKGSGICHIIYSAKGTGRRIFMQEKLKREDCMSFDGFINGLSADTINELIVNICTKYLEDKL